MKTIETLSIFAFALVITSCGEKKKAMQAEAATELTMEVAVVEETTPTIAAVTAGNDSF